jgi:hypothetical protein
MGRAASRILPAAGADFSIRYSQLMREMRSDSGQNAKAHIFQGNGADFSAFRPAKIAKREGIIKRS